jgi:hypothetical protein
MLLYDRCVKGVVGMNKGTPQQERVFKEFISVVNDFAKKHHWKYWGFRESNDGTCFYITCDLQKEIDWL